jgi:hypothetical protein
MTPQQEADRLLRIWQANRDKSPAHRMFLLGDHVPANSNLTEQQLDATLARVDDTMRSA